MYNTFTFSCKFLRGKKLPKPKLKKKQKEVVKYLCKEYFNLFFSHIRKMPTSSHLKEKKFRMNPPLVN